MPHLLRPVQKLYTANNQGKILDDISEYVVSPGIITANMDNAVQFTFSATLRSPFIPNLIKMLVKPWYQIEYEDSTTENYMGLFVISSIEPRHRKQSSEYVIGEMILRGYFPKKVITDAYSVTTASDPFTVMTNLMVSAGVPASMIHFANKDDQQDSVTAPPKFIRPKTWPPDRTTIELCNDICDIIGYYAIGANLSGIVGSEPIKNFETYEPDATYVSGGQHSMLVGEIVEETPPLTSFANEIIVRPSEPTLDEQGEPDDTGTPTPSNGRTVRVTERLRLRDAPSLDAPILLVMPVGTPAKRQLAPVR